MKVHQERFGNVPFAYVAIDQLLTAAATWQWCIFVPGHARDFPPPLTHTATFWVSVWQRALD